MTSENIKHQLIIIIMVVLCLLHCSLNCTLLLFLFFLWAHHDHNKIAPCGMIKVFELNWINLLKHTDFENGQKDIRMVYM